MRIYTQKELEVIQKGVIFFETEEDPLKEGTIGTGVVRYPEGSIYKGPLVYTGKTFEKSGFGRQNFLESTINNDDVGGPKGDTLYLYEGMYSYKKNDWIYGNGIFYFLKDGQPDAFCPGTYFGTIYVGEYTRDDLEEILLPEFKSAKRLTMLMPHEARIEKMEKALSQKGHYEYMLLGDSYFDFLGTHYTSNGQTVFDHYKKDNDICNVGIGGFRFLDFMPLIDRFVMKATPDQLIVNLGFNDIHASGSAETTIKQAKEFFSKVHSLLPNTLIYPITVAHTPAFPTYKEEEEKYNQWLIEYSKSVSYLRVIDAATVFSQLPDMTPYIEPDKLHPNTLGYSLWMPFILKQVKGYKLS